MAEAVVAIVAEGIKPLGDFILQKAKFLSAVSDQVELAQVELLLMLGYLKDADARQAEDEVVRIWVKIIRDAAYDLEDVIQSFALKVTLKKKGSIKLFVKRFACIFKEGVDLYKVGSEIETITTKLSKIRLSLQSYNIRDIRGSEGATSSFQRQQERRLTYPHVVEPNVVGLEDDVKELSMQLRKEEKCLRVVSIWGMGGSGKTTLAKQVYHHNEVKRHFDCFAWVCISQQCQGRAVLEEILVKLISATKDQREENARMKKDEIAEKLCITLREKKCLVVLDDIWNLDAWNSLKVGFPINGESDSRILLTTRINEVASHAEKVGFLYQPRPLNKDESWKLFEKIANIERDCADSEIYKKKKELGEKMLQHCVGLPLAITVLAGILAPKETIDEWEKVHMNASVFIRRGTALEQKYKGQGHEGTSWVLALSYDDLPYLLKLCFLYLGHFPEDFEIPVKMLTQLWIAEGFISLTSERCGSKEVVEDVSYNCLSELVKRCMVQVGRYGLTKKIKTCRLHDLMRDLCLLKVEEENFLHVVNFSASVKAAPIVGKVRRLAIYLDQEVDKLAPTRDGHVRSLLYFAPPHFHPKWNNQIIRSLFKDFKLLRVLKFEGILADELQLPSNIGSLVHLRFLSLQNCGYIRRLPSSIGNLVCLQTLDFRCGDCARKPVIIPNVIWKLDQLRHLYLPRRYRVRGIFKVMLQLGSLGNLQTLVNVRSSNWDLKDVAGLTNLRKLSLEVEEDTPWALAEEVLKSASITFNGLRSLYVESRNEEVLRGILLSCPHIYKLKLEGPIKELPEDFLASHRNLTKMHLFRTRLKEDQIKILEKLPQLRKLYLRSNHESIHSLVFSEGGFPLLEFLSLIWLSQLKEWGVEKGAMPSLCRLHIERCEQLRAVPDGLQDVMTLKELTIDGMPRTFCDRLGAVGEDFDKIKHVPSLIISHSRV